MYFTQCCGPQVGGANEGGLLRPALRGLLLDQGLLYCAFPVALEL
jgi:hypothetical protein